MFLDHLRGLFKRRSNRQQRRSKRPPSFRPYLEAFEERLALATKVWLGTVSENVTVADNWQGGLPGVNDEAVFNNNATRNAELAAGDTLTVGKLTVATNFARAFNVSGTFYLSMGAVAGNSTWASTTLLALQGADARFNITGNGTMIFSKGGVFTSGQLGTVNVTNGATLKFTEDGRAFAANLIVGDGSTAGTVEVGSLSGDLLTGNENSGANITVTSTGTFKMTETGDTAGGPKGGLTQGGTALGTFTNQGTFIRDGVTSGPHYPKVDYVFTNTGLLKVTPGSNIRFSRQNDQGLSIINNSGGTVELHYGAFVRAEGKYQQNGGIFETRGDPVVGAGSVFFEVKSDFLGGSVYVNRDSGFGTLEFGNNDVKFAGPVRIYLKLDGTSPITNEAGDQINVSGASAITIDNSGANKPTLVLTTMGAAPPAMWEFEVMHAPNMVGEPFVQLDFQGQNPPNGYTVDYPSGPPRSVRVRRA